MKKYEAYLLIVLIIVLVFFPSLRIYFLILFLIYAMMKNKKKKPKEIERNENNQYSSNEENSQNSFFSAEFEYQRTKAVNKKRKQMPCFFDDGISYDDFVRIVRESKNEIKRIKEASVYDAEIYCTVESQTGLSDWSFTLDFNNWGHIDGTYWRTTSNTDSLIPKHFGDIISSKIFNLIRERNLYIRDYDKIVESNRDLETENGLFVNIDVKTFPFNQRYIYMECDSEELIGEHIYSVISFLKNNGFTKIKSIPIPDVGDEDSNYIYQVEQVVIGGTSFFEENDSFDRETQVIITYHEKKKVKIPFTQKYWVGKDYNEVGCELKKLGFSNLYLRPIEDLVLGWFTKDGEVEQVLIDVNGEITLEKNSVYLYDEKIIICYHTFKQKE